MSSRPRWVWYAAYGSNMAVERLRCYVQGGRAVGGVRTYPGCRERGMPGAARRVELPGRLYFAEQSWQWGGGMGFYEAGAGVVPARAYRVTVGQFSDIAAQEMYHPPGTDLDLTAVLATGRAELGPGRYETLLLVGEVEGEPMLTFTAPWSLAEARLNAPAAAYLRQLATGLAEAHGWGTGRIAAYLASRPGAAGHWSAASVTELLS
ncbi:histone deacetylase [Kitasatospora sp. RB6PN24]|uniref:histone deacetylase n=1 Tax=Kitasatospora humi TaxID=2893891 RepID=UPI001E4C137F|nr:histone deacetylase [Kitasatospora humi]MCC9309453.1 histone deacetylase [Kitasatospora humi]